MLGFIKMSGLSAVLSFVLVTGYGHVAAPAAPAGSAKAYQQRLGEASPAPHAGAAVLVSGRKGDRLEGAPDGCAGQTWPYLGAACIQAADGAEKREHVRFVTVESREGVNVSVLRRVPQTDVALR
jgi:hypothetical protein